MTTTTNNRTLEDIQSVSVSEDFGMAVAMDYLHSYARTVIKIPVARSDHSWRTRSSVGCPSPSKPTPVSQEDVIRIKAVAAIERWWSGVRDRRVFKILKEAICASEHSLTQEILRKVSPAEAELLKDPAIQARVKFRFGGSEFPPTILFKVFVSSRGGVQYISGKRMIRPASEAAKDARRQMGNRRFYDQMLLDACHHHQMKVTDEVDVTTMKEYMQFVASVDESPAYMGGKENVWRKLNLDVLPHHSFLHNIVTFLERAHMPGGLSLERLQSFTRPPTQAEQIEQIKAVTSMSSQGLSPRRPPSSASLQDRVPSRRTRQAQRRVEKMRRAYNTRERNDDEMLAGRLTAATEPDGRAEEGLSEDQQQQRGHSDLKDEKREGEEEEEWEKEAYELYQWSQELSFDDIR